MNSSVALAVTPYDEQGKQLRDAYLSRWSTFASAERLSRAWALAEPIGALHHAVSYRSLVAGLQPPIDQHMAESTAFWLRRVLAGLQQIDES